MSALKRLWSWWLWKWEACGLVSLCLRNQEGGKNYKVFVNLKLCLSIPGITILLHSMLPHAHQDFRLHNIVFIASKVINNLVITKRLFLVCEYQVQQRFVLVGAATICMRKQSSMHSKNLEDNMRFCIVPANVWVIEVTHKKQVLLTEILPKWPKYCFVLVWRSMVDACSKMSLWDHLSDLDLEAFNRENWLLFLKTGSYLYKSAYTIYCNPPVTWVVPPCSYVSVVPMVS